MGEVFERVERCVRSIRKVTDFVPKAALVLGSGLGDYADSIEVVSEVPYSSIEDFPVSTVPGHDGRFIFGFAGGMPIVCMKGRVHHYEGYGMQDVVLPIRVMRRLGAGILFLTNAAGGLKDGMKPGDFMLITDHISCFVENPLIGKNEEQIGPRFPDMSHVYDPDLCERIKDAARRNKIELTEGVYTQLTGPSYETPAEIRMLKVLGTDAVGMSTVVEAIAAAHMGMRVCGISCISNLASGLSDKQLNHKEVQEVADKVSGQFQTLVTECLKNFSR